MTDEKQDLLTDEDIQEGLEVGVKGILQSRVTASVAVAIIIWVAQRVGLETGTWDQNSLIDYITQVMGVTSLVAILYFRSAATKRIKGLWVSKNV